MPGNSSGSQGKTVQKLSEGVRVRQPEITGDQPPIAVIWGIFKGPKVHMHGALYLEIESENVQLKRFNLALFDTEEPLSTYDPQDRPLLFQQSVTKKSGANDEITQSDFDMVKINIEKYIANEAKHADLFKFLEETDKKEFNKWVHDLLSTFIRKGKLVFDINGQLTSQKALSRSMKAAMTERHGRSEGELAEGEEAEEETETYHQLSVVTLPIRGIPPDELIPGEEIYVRALGAVVEHFPDELRSDRYEFATIPIEATVESVKSDPDLPSSYEGEPENYYEVIARFGKGEKGKGFIYKSEKIKPVHISEDNIKPDRIIPILLGVGLLASILSLIAFFIFG
jgi:hypothetical protein